MFFNQPHWVFRVRMERALEEGNYAAAKRYRKLITREGIFIAWPWS